MVICLERGADLHMAQRIPLPLTVSCFSKIQIGLPFWYRLTWVVPDKGPLNGCVCVMGSSDGGFARVHWVWLCNMLIGWIYLFINAAVWFGFCESVWCFWWQKFFRRGLVEYMSYRCKNEGCCLINPQTRNLCRFCRYQKCIAAGMSRNGIFYCPYK